MKKLKNFFRKKEANSTKNSKSQTEDRENNIDHIFRFKLMLNRTTGKYEKVLVYHIDELSEDEA
mgnify:CR=1 FL=1